MVGLILFILILLWFFGYIHIAWLPIPDIVLFHINSRPITLWDLLLLLVISWMIKVLPSPFREIAIILIVLWLLSTLGILVIGGLSSLLVLLLIIWLMFFLFGGIFFF